MEAYKVLENAGLLYLCFARYSNDEKLLKIGYSRSAHIVLIVYYNKILSEKIYYVWIAR